MHYRLYNRESDHSTLWIVNDEDPRSNETEIVAQQVTSSSHLWERIPGTEALVPRADLIGSYKSIDVTD